jgi:hypothetical protein
MQRQLVSSSTLREVGYDDAAATLEIMFKSGAVYQYYHVPSEVHLKLIAAGSLGFYFNTYIKGRYGDMRVG